MHIHYLALEKLAETLRRQILGEMLVEAFSQQKDELILGFAGTDTEHYLRVNCAPPLPYIWPVGHFGKARKNVSLLMRGLEGKTVSDVKAVPWERQLRIILNDGHELVLKMHGNQSNVIWLHRGKIKHLFRGSLESDQAFALQAGHFDHEMAEAGPGDSPLKDWLRQVSPTLDRHFLDRVSQSVSEGQSPSAALATVMTEAQDDTFYILRDANRLRFLLFRPAELPEHCLTLTGFQATLDIFLKSWYQFGAYSRIWTQSHKTLSQHLKKFRGRKESYETSLYTLLESRDPEEIGHLIMANLHTLKQGMEKVEVQDLYTGQPIILTLKPELNPQKNAEIWYRKQKNRKASFAKLEKELEAVERTLLVLEQAWAQLLAFPAPEMLELGENGFDGSLLRQLQGWKKSHDALLGTGELPENAAKHPFKEFRREGFLILAGRNAKSNDALTFGFSNKEDLWLHARDATGSHVIIRHDGREVPMHIREFAAGIAAALSERKNEGWVTVICTPRKFIRKPRDGRPGQAIVEREEVLLVEPHLPEH